MAIKMKRGMDPGWLSNINSTLGLTLGWLLSLKEYRIGSCWLLFIIMVPMVVDYSSVDGSLLLMGFKLMAGAVASCALIVLKLGLS